MSIDAEQREQTNVTTSERGRPGAPSGEPLLDPERGRVGALSGEPSLDPAQLRHRRPPKPATLLLILLLAAAAWWYFTTASAPPPNEIRASGSIEAEEVSIAPEVPGRIAQILPEEGDRVRAGDLLIKLDDSVAQLQMKMASQTERPLLELQLEKMSLRSPIDGVVTRRSLRVGEVASPGTVAMVVAKQDPVELTLYVPEGEIGKVKVGQPVDVTVDSFPKEVFPGSVTFIATKAEFTPRNVQTQKDRLNLVFAVKVWIPNADLRLKPGMPADAVIRTED